MGRGVPTHASTKHALLVWLGRILPAEFVRRVAEPAFMDELYRWSSGARVPLFARTRFVCSCLWVGAPRVFWDRRRPTAITVVLLGSALVLIVAILLWAKTVYQDLPGP